MIAWKSLQLLLLCAILAAWSNAQAQEAKPNGSQLQPVYSPANPKGGWKVKSRRLGARIPYSNPSCSPPLGPSRIGTAAKRKDFIFLKASTSFAWGLQVIKAGPGDFLFAPRRKTTRGNRHRLPTASGSP